MLVGVEVIKESLMLTTALSLGAAVSDASCYSFYNAHQGNIGTNKY